MPSLGTDLCILWVTAFVLIFGFLLFGSASLQDRQTHIVTYGGVGLVLLAAIVVTVGQLVGFIGVW